MKSKNLNAKLKENGFDGFSVQETEEAFILTGQSDSWDKIVGAGFCVAKKFSKKHLLNDCVFTGGEIIQMHQPNFSDTTLEGERPDVLIIGGGIIGASIARELMRKKLSVLLVEKEHDLALGASGRNDGCIHPGADLVGESLKRKYNYAGNRMYGRLSEELDFEFDRCGYIVAMTGDKLKIVKFAFPLIKLHFKLKGLGNIKLLSAEELKAREPAISDNIKLGALFPTGGIVCPYNATIAFAENAVENGAKVSLNTAVLGMEINEGKILSVKTNRGTIYPMLVVNAAGVFNEDIAKMADDRFYSIHPRKGTNTILDKKIPLVNSPYSIIGGGSKEGHTKGGGIVRTVDNNSLIGPDAVETYKKEDHTTEPKSIIDVFEKQCKATEMLHMSDTITYFTGVRAPTFEEDFIVERGRRCKNLVHAAGIQSPGLTGAPAIAVDIAKICTKVLRELGEKVENNESFNPIRKGIPALAKMSDTERNELIKKNPAYGEIVCRCEEISRGEILDALHRNIPCDTVDGVKKRCRPGMGRCQGGFCGPLVAQIIAEEKKIPLHEVRKAGGESRLLYGKSKEGINHA